MGEERFFYHSFPRPRAEEDASSTLERGLQILAYMKEVGLVLAPEVVQWDASALSTKDEKVQILQRRACFTELAQFELPEHSRTFGPISLAFGIADLRAAGALPVIYAPQGVQDLKYPLIFKRGRKPRRRLRFGVEVLRIARLAAAAWPLACWE